MLCHIYPEEFLLLIAVFPAPLFCVKPHEDMPDLYTSLFLNNS